MATLAVAISSQDFAQFLFPFFMLAMTAAPLRAWAKAPGETAR
jgi:hypothetical protein